MIGTKKNVSWTAFAFLGAVLAAIASLYFYNIVVWGKYPDFGFSFHSSTGIHVIAEVSEHGSEAGFRRGDRIVKVNGKTFSSLQEFRSAMHRSLGESNTYLLDRNGHPDSVIIRNVPSGFKRSFVKSGLPYLLGISYIFIGVIVFLMKRHHRTSWIFLLLTSTQGLYLIFLFKMGVMTPYWLTSVQIFTNTFSPAVIIHLAFVFPEERTTLIRKRGVQIIPYIVSAVLCAGILFHGVDIADAPRGWFIATAVYLIFADLFFLASCAQLWLGSSSAIVKLRSKLILLGTAIAVSLPVIDLLGSIFFHVKLVSDLNFYLPFYIVLPLFLGYSIVKHDLFGFDAIIKRTYGYVLTTGVVAGIYGIFVLVTNVFFGRFELTKSSWFPIVFILAVVFLFNPVRNRLQRFIDRTFYRLEYDYQETVRRIGEAMRSLMNLRDIGTRMMELAAGTMFIDHGSLILLSRDRKEYRRLVFQGSTEKQPAASRAGGEVPGDERPHGSVLLGGSAAHGSAPDGPQAGSVSGDPPGGGQSGDIRQEGFRLPKEDPLMQKIAERKREVTIYDIQEDPLFEMEKEACAETLNRLDATLVVPLIYEDRLTGLMALGRKKSGKFYRREDINLLNTLANQGAVAIENALLLEDVIEKERMEEELTIARDLQTSMLPADCPEIPGFEIAAVSMSAREVGGDFYDFIDAGENRVGIVIGDVTGKSVSGALVMAASRSVFRMLSEESVGVGEIMNRANRRLKQDVTSGMFVALLYGFLDGNDGTFRLCSAGQTQPVYVSSRTGEVGLVETEGDTFPLGILDEVQYEETPVQLSPGDTLVLYTDGIVEAMNKKEEVFGFDRLLDVVKAARSDSADALLKEILARVDEFVGGVDQHDDLTVIVITAKDARPAVRH